MRRLSRVARPIVSVVAAILVAITTTTAHSDDPLPSWNDCPAKHAMGERLYCG
jgi:hypothetical protein